MYYLEDLADGNSSDKLVFQAIDHCITGQQYSSRQLVNLCEQYIMQPEYRSNYLNLVVLIYQTQKIIRFSLTKFIQELMEQDYIIPGDNAKIYIQNDETFIQFRNNFFRCFKNLSQEEKQKAQQLQLTTAIFFAIINKDYNKFVKLTGFKGIERKQRKTQQLKRQQSLASQKQLQQPQQQQSTQSIQQSLLQQNNITFIEEEYEEEEESMTDTLSSIQTDIEEKKEKEKRKNQEPEIDLQLEDQQSLSFEIDEEEIIQQLSKEVEEKHNQDAQKLNLSGHYSQRDNRSQRTRYTVKTKQSSNSGKSKLSYTGQSNKTENSNLQQSTDSGQLKMSDLVQSPQNRFKGQQSMLLQSQLQAELESDYDYEYIEEDYDEYDSQFSYDEIDLDEIHKNLPYIFNQIDDDSWENIESEQIQQNNQTLIRNQVRRIYFLWKQNIVNNQIQIIVSNDIILNILKDDMLALQVFQQQIFNKWEQKLGIKILLNEQDIENILQLNIDYVKQIFQDIQIQDRNTIFQISDQKIKTEQKQLQLVFDLVQNSQIQDYSEYLNNFDYQYITQQIQLQNIEKAKKAALFYLSQDEKDKDMSQLRPEYQYTNVHQLINDISQQKIFSKIIGYKKQSKPQISQAMLSEVQEAFSLFDSNKSGVIDAQELRLCLRALGFDLNRQEIQKILIQYNAQDSGEITKDQFIEIASEKIMNRDPIQEIIKAFKLFDQDGTGKITLQNLRQVAKDLGENTSDDELRAMIQEFDRTGEGYINQDDFVEIMKGCGAFIQIRIIFLSLDNIRFQISQNQVNLSSFYSIYLNSLITKSESSWWSKEPIPIDLPVASEIVNPKQLHKILETTKDTSPEEISEIIDKAYDHALLKHVNPCELKGEYIQGLPLEDVGKLLNFDFTNNKELEQKLFDTAFAIKNRIYGNRIVLFAPIYTSNLCSNSCSYCGYRCANDELERQTVSDDELRREVKYLTDNGFKRTLMLCGEHPRYTFDQFLHQVNVAAENPDMRRINIEIPPLSYHDLRRAKTEGHKVGTEICFQETYDPVEYKKYHKSGPKSNYQNRLTLMHRSLKAGLDDVGLGVLYGLADYKFDTLAMIQHANCLNDTFGVGPHTVSMPRIQPALGAETSQHIPCPVSDDQFKQLIAILRLSIPYTGMILSTRENAQLRTELLRIGISQLSAGSQTNPGGYTRRSHHEDPKQTEQFHLSDERTLDEITYELLKDGFQPSHCTSCYGVGRTGQTFMQWAKTGEIQDYCLPNGLLTLQEYLSDFASPKTKQLGEKVIQDQLKHIKSENRRKETQKRLDEIKYDGVRGKLF